MAGEEGVLPAQGHGTDLVLDRIGVHFDPAVLDEEGEACPMIEPIGDGAPEIGLRGDPRTLLPEPETEIREFGGGACPPLGATQPGRLSPDRLLDGVEAGDPPEGFVHDR